MLPRPAVHTFLTCTMLALLHLNCSLVLAQVSTLPQIQPFRLPQERSGEKRPPLPEYQEPTPPELELSPITPPEDRDRLSTQVRVSVRQFKLTGNTVFSDEKLAEVTKPYQNRVITSEELQEVRHKLTLFYVNRGYINSGAIIPDQQVADGVIHIQIIEGELTDIEVTGHKRLQAGYISKRLAIDTEEALNIRQLQQNLQLLQQNPLIELLNAELAPGLMPGESILRVQVKEAKPYQLGVIFANDRPPSVGAERARLYGAYRNLTGWGDTIAIQYGITEGADDVSVFYTLPISARDTLLQLGFDRSDSTVIEQPFRDIDIDSELETYSIRLDHPFYRTSQRRFSMGLGLDRRHSETSLLGRPFSFSPGVQDGESDVTVVRFSQDWLDRRLNQVIAARSTFSVGIDALSATSGAEPDGQFFAWLGQFQLARRFGERGYQAILRADLQLANQSLLPLEQFAVGGARTVRGYRENQLVRDNGWVASLEFRIPVFRLPIPGLSQEPGEGMVQLAPFVDFGRAWNKDLSTPDPEEISSVGLGVRWDPVSQIHAELYWGQALRNVDSPGGDLQDSGVHFLVQVFYP